MLERFFHWTCDLCAKTEQKHSHGFPDGWRMLLPHVKGKSGLHACRECIKENGYDEDDFVEVEKKGNGFPLNPPN